MKKAKVKPKRDSVEHASLDPKYNSRIRQEYLDLDYVKKLDDTKKIHKLPDGTLVTEKEWMAIFMKEWNNAGVGKQSEARKNKLHRTKKTVKECTDRNNHRNADIYGRARAMKALHLVESNTLRKYIENQREVENDVEDTMIDYLDQAKQVGNTGSESDE